MQDSRNGSLDLMVLDPSLIGVFVAVENWTVFPIDFHSVTGVSMRAATSRLSRLNPSRIGFTVPIAGHEKYETLGS
jgi:predicted phosphoribosyltransferase